MREELTKVEATLSPSSTICTLITEDGNLSPSISKEESTKTGNQFSQRKKNCCWLRIKFHPFTHLVYYVEPLIQWRKQNVSNSTQSLFSGDSYWCRSTRLVKKKWQERLSMPKEIQHLVQEEREHKSSLRENWETLWLLYGSYERLSTWFQSLWVVLYKVIFSQNIFLQVLTFSRDEWSNKWSIWRCCRRKIFWKRKKQQIFLEFCNQATLPRSEIVFFVQMFVVLQLISLCVLS